MDDNTEVIGSFTFAVEFREHEREARQRFEKRAETLTAWLIAQWQKQHKEVEHDCHSQAG
jgi:hypothetical protein